VRRVDGRRINRPYRPEAAGKGAKAAQGTAGQGCRMDLCAEGSRMEAAT
jgi:hypothetical protein